MAATKTEGRAPSKANIELFSPTYFGACALGGIVSCGPTHTCKNRPPTSWQAMIEVHQTDPNLAVTPLDLVSHLPNIAHNPRA